jgi:hypothetical protein
VAYLIGAALVAVAFVVAFVALRSEAAEREATSTEPGAAYSEAA